MGTPPANVSRAVKAAVVALLLLGLLIVVAIAARGAHPSGHGHVAQRHVPDQVNNDVLTILLVLYVLGAVALVAAFIYSKSAWQPVESHWLRNMITTLVVFTLIAAIGYRLAHSGALHRRAQEVAQQQLKAGSKAGTPPVPRNLRRRTSGGARFDTSLALGLLGLLLIGGAIYYVRGRSAGAASEPDPDSDVKSALADAVSDAIDDLRDEPDARRAVIAAYARMERALARHGHARDPSATPLEYLTRILTELDVGAHAVEELTALFEHAKFSTHPIDVSMKERAIAALISIRRDLDEPAVAA